MRKKTLRGVSEEVWDTGHLLSGKWQSCSDTAFKVTPAEQSSPTVLGICLGDGDGVEDILSVHSEFEIDSVPWDIAADQELERLLGFLILASRDEPR